MITTALNLVYQEIQRLQVDHNIALSIPLPDAPHPSTSHTVSPSTQPPLNLQTTSHHVSTHHSTSPSISPGGADINTSTNQYYPYQQPMQAPGFGAPPQGLPRLAVMHDVGSGLPEALMSLDNPASYEITPEVFEAFSYAEPITTNVTPAEGYGWVSRP